MDTAFCTIDNKSYDIASFSKLEEHILSNLRRALVCQQCNSRGYYRKKSRDGKSACFGAYHQDNCEYKIQGSASRIIQKIVKEVNAFATNNHIIDIVFGTYEPNGVPSTNGLNSNTKLTSSSVSQQHTQNPVQKRNTSRGLKSFLKMLMHTDTFASSDIKINTGARYPFKAKNLFVHFNKISTKHEKKWRGYWGIISHSDPDVSWLNVANEEYVSIPVASLKRYILKMCKIKSHEELAGASILVFGRLHISKNGKWYIEIDNDNSGHIYIKIAK